MRRVFLLLVLLLDPHRLVFLDETGCHISMTRTHARAPPGVRVVEHVPRNRGVVTTVLGAMALDGIRALMTIEGATTADVFEAFVESMLVPRLNPGDIVVMDNVGALWNKFKELLRSMAARTPRELDHAIAEAMALTTLEDIASWFKHCGYKI
ncbi:transposase [Cystobacter fuscus]|uniref:transposase n=1 Tax=Cystobacter fuscus TaxID=43 RepID=UPI0034CDAB34